MNPDDQARAASFGAVAEQYDRARPRYPAVLTDDLTGGRRQAAGGRRLRVLDVGCGTGVSSRTFLDRGCEVQGVEHDEEMAAVARRHGMHVDVGRFEDWTPPSTGFDLVISGQAWHWIDPCAGAMKAADALVPGGRLAVFWIEYRHRPEVQQAFDQTYRRIAPTLLSTSHPLGRAGDGAQEDMAQQYATAVDQSLRFEPTEVRHYTADRIYGTLQWLDELPTHSDHQLLPAADLTALLSLLRIGIDQIGGEIVVEQRTHLVLAQAHR